MMYINKISVEIYNDLAKCSEAFQEPCIQAVDDFSNQGPKWPVKGAQSVYLTLILIDWAKLASDYQKTA